MKRSFIKKIFFPLTVTLFIVSIIILFTRAGSPESTGTEPVDEFSDNYVITSVDIPEELYFAGEPVPLSNFDVRESLDRELLVNTYWQSHTLLLIKRAHRYFPEIEKVLREYNVPGDFKYLAVAESDLMNAVSPANAVGYWQLLRGTARELGLEVNGEVDERYHLVKSTEAACKFLLKSYEMYGNWTMAAASYNAGRTGMNRQIERQSAEDYYDLLLNSETARYIYRILALKLILSSPGDYGFVVGNDDLYPRIRTYEVTIDTPVEDFAALAKRYNINYKILKYFNPWLRESYLTNARRKTYYIRIPESGYREFDHTHAEKTDIRGIS